MRNLFNTIKAYARATIVLATKPKLFTLAIIPWLSGIIIWCGLFIWSFSYRDMLVQQIHTDVAQYVEFLLSGLLIPLLFIISGVCSLLITLIINEFFLDTLIIGFCKEFGVHNAEAIKSRSILQQTADAFLRLLIIVPLTIFCFVFGLIPVIGLLALPLSYFVFGFTVIDYPLSVLGWNFGERVTWCRTHALTVLWFGAIFSLTFFIPFGAILFLPIGYGASIALLVNISNMPNENAVVIADEKLGPGQQ